MKEYIRQKQSKQKEWLLYNTIPIHIVNPYPSNINIQNIIDNIEKKIPHFYFTNIENMYVGNFKELKKKDMQALFMDGSIYLSNHENGTIADINQITKDITHEVAHAVEQTVGLSIYGDSQLQNEFLAKRRKLASLLEIEGFDINSYNFFETEYDENFDKFLQNVVGYKKLSILIIGLFDSPYSATSINEYFANGFEDYYLGNISYLKNISPVLYNKVASLPSYLRELS